MKCDSMIDTGKVYILILNWNGWADTIECLESVFRNDYPKFQVIVCDNDSQDSSIEKIKAWADGYLDVYIHKDTPLRSLSFPPVTKPIQYIEYSRSQVEAIGNHDSSGSPLILIRTGANLGFAGGNNVGMRYALSRDDFAYVWLLNNDTVIPSNSLNPLVNKFQNNINIGICGSTLHYYDQPNIIQALGGAVYNKWLATIKHITKPKCDEIPIDSKEIESKMKYVIGASMFVSKKFLVEVGFLCEDYFIYFEEIDWATRANGKFLLAYAPESIVYHKEGRSSQSSSLDCNKSYVADYHCLKNRILFTKKHFNKYILFVYLGLVLTLIKRAINQQWDRVIMIIKLVRKV